MDDLKADRFSFTTTPQADDEDKTATDMAVLLFETATLRSGYQLGDTKEFAGRIERMLRLSMNVDQDEQASLQPFLLRFQTPSGFNLSNAKRRRSC